jgi:hypothetical protein
MGDEQGSGSSRTTGVAAARTHLSRTRASRVRRTTPLVKIQSTDVRNDDGAAVHGRAARSPSVETSYAACASAEPSSPGSLPGAAPASGAASACGAAAAGAGARAGSRHTNATSRAHGGLCELQTTTVRS